MAWNKTLPGNSEKIRNLGSVIRPNWEAIEEGDDVGVSDMLQMRSVQLDNRTGLAANNDPQTNAGTHYLYSKDDAGAVQEAFMKDSAANIMQMSQGGRLGSDTTDIGFESFSHNTGTTSFDENNFVAAWGYVIDSSLTVSPSSGVASVTRPVAGTYRVVLSANVTQNANYVMVAMAVGSTAYCVRDTTFAQTTTNFQIIRRTAAALASGDFMFFVIGGQ